jgi:protoheme IX farnesyltransferase
MNQTVEAVSVPVTAPVTRARIADFVALTKPGITFMVSITAAVGYWLAARESFEAHVLLRLLIGTVLSAAGAAALNQVLERNLDAKMERTRNRPLPAGRMKVAPAAAFGIVLAAAGLAHLAGAVNLLTAGLSLATIVSYLFLYTPLKTKTSLCTIVGAVPGALPPVMGWAAARGSLEAGAAILFMILFFWQLPHFLALAWMYREDYARGGFPMLSVEGPDGASTGRQVVLQTLALIVVSILPMGFGMAGEMYLVAALFLGAGFLGFGIAFAVERSRARASRLFFASIFYLPLLLAALALL